MSILSDAFQHRCEVLFSDLDVNGRVHHLAYLRYAEAARVQALSRYGLTPTELADYGVAVVVLALEASLHSSVSFTDTVIATAKYEFGAGKSFRCAQELRTGSDRSVATIDLVLGLLDRCSGRLDGEPLRKLTELAHG